MWTSYFGNMKNLPADARLVAITRFPPKWYKGEVDKRLAPSQQLLTEYKAGNVSESLYTALFKKQLAELDREQIRKELGENTVLLCFEKDGFCHRHIVGEWLGIEEFR